MSQSPAEPSQTGPPVEAGKGPGVEAGNEEDGGKDPGTATERAGEGKGAKDGEEDSVQSKGEEAMAEEEGGEKEAGRGESSAQCPGHCREHSVLWNE